MNKTNIEYLNYTWNPITMHCTPITESCENCWHLAVAKRLSKNPKISPLKRRIFSEQTCPHLFRSELELPLIKRKKPSTIGVQFMGDLFHKDVPFHFVDRIFAEMENADWHKYLILTKRPGRMLEYHQYCEYENTDGSGKLDTSNYEHPEHIWLGVTAENQKRADERIPILLQIPAAVRFVSVEPMLEAIDLRNYLIEPDCSCYEFIGGHQPGCYYHRYKGGSPPKMLDWVICGAETGPGARYMKPEWAYDLYDQCKKAGIPFFFKKASKGDKINLPREYPIC